MPGLIQEWPWPQKQGDAARFTIEYQEDDGTPIDLTGWTPELAIAKARGRAFLQRWTAAPQVEIVTSAASAPNVKAGMRMLSTRQSAIPFGNRDGERQTDQYRHHEFLHARHRTHSHALIREKEHHHER